MPSFADIREKRRRDVKFLASWTEKKKEKNVRVLASQDLF